MIPKQRKSIALEILKSNIYLTLATTDRDFPWAAPVYYCMDSEYHFYFVSQIDTLHSTHIMNNPRVAFAIFDSCQPEGQGNGVQGSGVVTILEGDQIIEGMRHYSTTFFTLSLEMLTPPSPFRMFKITPNKLFILDYEEKGDKRVEVDLNC